MYPSIQTRTTLPKGLAGHSMVEIGENLYVIGGFSPDGTSSPYPVSKGIQKLTSWTTLTQQLKVGRGYTVAIPVIDSFCTPN